MTKETLLIVEDNLVLLEGLKEILSEKGFHILAAANGREAIEQMNRENPDLILSDIAMPEMDGFAFYQAVRSKPQWVTIPFIFLTARGEKEDILAGKTLGVEDYLVKPLTPHELFTVVRSRLDRSRQVRRAQLQEAHEAITTLLANAIEVRDLYTRGHIERVRDYSLVLATELGWKGDALEQLRFSSILHDIGKIHVDERTLNKAGPLDQDEWAEIRQHPVSGACMIKGIPFLEPAIPVIRHHHERWDGKGYPDGLAGEAIPMGARIIAVADAFDAMTTHRSYCPARSPEEAYAEILSCSGSQFDPAVVEAFKKAWCAGKIRSIWAGWFEDPNLQ